MTMNFFTPSGKRRWGILPILHIRFSFNNGHVETVRLYDFKIEDGVMSWVRAPGQGVFKFPIDVLTTWAVIGKTYRLGIMDVFKSKWRKGVK